MKRIMTMLLGVFALAISVLAVSAVAGAPPTGSVDTSNRVIFNSGSLTGVFEGNVPHISFYATNELGPTTYELNFRSLIAFSTSSGVSTYESPRLVAVAHFASASWTASNFYPVKDKTTGTTIGMGFNFPLNNQMTIVKRPHRLNPSNQAT